MFLASEHIRQVGCLEGPPDVPRQILRSPRKDEAVARDHEPSPTFDQVCSYLTTSSMRRDPGTRNGNDSHIAGVLSNAQMEPLAVSVSVSTRQRWRPGTENPWRDADARQTRRGRAAALYRCLMNGPRDSRPPWRHGEARALWLCICRRVWALAVRAAAAPRCPIAKARCHWVCVGGRGE